MARDFEFNENVDEELGLWVELNLVRPVAQEVFDDAHRTVPIDTGDLQKSLQLVRVDEDTYFIGSDLHYAGYVEFGTRYTHAQPYLRSAIYRVRTK